MGYFYILPTSICTKFGITKCLLSRLDDHRSDFREEACFSRVWRCPESASRKIENYVRAALSKAPQHSPERVRVDCALVEQIAKEAIASLDIEAEELDWDDIRKDPAFGRKRLLGIAGPVDTIMRFKKLCRTERRTYGDMLEILMDCSEVA